MTDAPQHAPGDRALTLMGKLLEERPSNVGHDFSETARCLSAYRNELTGKWRTSGAEHDRARLEDVNAVLSVVVGGHFPLGAIPWEHIEKARGRLEKVVRGEA